MRLVITRCDDAAADDANGDGHAMVVMMMMYTMMRAAVLG